MLYDFTFLVGDEKESTKVKELLTSFSGKVAKEDAWGKKGLAYPVKN